MMITKKEWSDRDIRELAKEASREADLDACCLLIQNRLKVRSGDLAGQIWSGRESYKWEDPDLREDAVQAYIFAEIEYGDLEEDAEDYHDGECARCGVALGPYGFDPDVMFGALEKTCEDCRGGGEG
jgi:hypothetical protein